MTTTVRPPVPPPPARATRWTAGRTVAVTVSALFLLVGAILVLAGVGAAAVSTALRGDDGRYTMSARPWSSPGYAVQSEPARMHTPMMGDLPRHVLGTVSVTVRGDDDVFVGLARTADVDAYLRGVARSTVADPWEPDGPRTTYANGAAPATPPGAQPIWVARSSGPGERTITWEPRSGTWTLVVMNSDGTAPVAADVTMSAELPFVGALGLTLIVMGLLVILLSGVGLWLAVPRSPSVDGQSVPPPPG